MSKYKNKNIIDFGDICTYSMHPLKKFERMGRWRIYGNK